MRSKFTKSTKEFRPGYVVSYRGKLYVVSRELDYYKNGRDGERYRGYELISFDGHVFRVSEQHDEKEEIFCRYGSEDVHDCFQEECEWECSKVLYAEKSSLDMTKRVYDSIESMIMDKVKKFFFYVEKESVNYILEDEEKNVNYIIEDENV